MSSLDNFAEAKISLIDSAEKSMFHKFETITIGLQWFSNEFDARDKKMH